MQLVQDQGVNTICCLAGMDRSARVRASTELGTMSKRSDWKIGRVELGEVFLENLSGKEPQMDDERKSSKAGKQAAEGLREATAKEEAKNESKMGHDLAKGADRFEERSKSSDGRSAQEKQKG
jgi:hypothetical protein